MSKRLILKPNAGQPEGPGALRRLLAGGIRVGGGILSSPGGWYGAGVGGFSEALAQAAEELGTDEGLSLDKKRIGIEAGIAAIPFGKVVKGGGKLLRDAAVSGALTGSGEALRQGYAGEDSGWLPDVEKIDKGSVGLAGLLGFLSGGIGSAVKSRYDAQQPTHPSYELETTAQPGGQVLGQKKGQLSHIPPARTLPGEGPKTPAPAAPSKAVDYVQPEAQLDPLERWLGYVREDAGLVARPRPEGPSLPPEMRGQPRQRAAAEEIVPEQKSRTPYGLGDPDSGGITRADQLAGLDVGEAVPAAVHSASRWTPERIEELASKYEQAGRPDVAAQIREVGSAGRVPYGAVEPAPYRSAAKAAQKAEDAAVENTRKLEQAERMKAGLEPQEPTVTETVEGVTEEGVKVRGSRKFSAPQDEPLAELNEFLQTGRVSRGGRRWKGVRVEDIPKEGKALEIFEAWLERGKSPKQALKLAAKGSPPVGSGIEVPGTRRVVRPAEEPTSTSPGPAVTAVTPEPPPSAVSQVAEELKPSPVAQVVEDLAPAVTTPSVVADVVEEVPPSGAGEALRFFRPREVADLAGESYRALKEAQKDPSFLDALRGKLPLDPRGREITPYHMAGMELRRRAAQAGQPTGAAAKSPVANPPAPTHIEAPRTQYSHPSVEGDPMQQLRDVADLTNKLKDLGVKGGTDLAESVGLIERLKALNKAKGDKGGGFSAPFLGMSPDIIRALERNPELAGQLLAGGVGAGVGAAFSDDPLTGAGLGFAGGFAAPKVIPAVLKAVGAPVEAVRNMEFNLSNPEGVKQAAQQIFQTLPQLQRFNLLADINGLPANAIIGPWGSAIMGSLEHALAGDPRGWAALKQLRNPVSFFQQMRGNMDEAWQRLQTGDLGRSEQGLIQRLPESAQKYGLAAPGLAMTTGDITARRILLNAGFSDDEARMITLTSEPVAATFKKIANFTKGSTPLQLLFPFTRTPANIAEQGLQRMPIIGSFMEQSTPAHQQLIAQYGVTPAVGMAGYFAGENMDPESAKTWRRYITNLGGQYSLAAGLGFTAGQVARRGTPMNAFEKQRVLDQALPLPSTEPLIELGSYLFGEGRMPRSVRPQILENLGIIEAPQQATRSRRLILRRQS